MEEILCTGGCVATKYSSFSQSVPSMERLSKTYMTLSHISWWYLWLCQTFIVKCLLGSVSHIAGLQLISTFFLSFWHISAQYTAFQLCLVIYFALSHIKVSIFIERDTDVKRFSISPRSDVPAFSGSMPWRKALNSAAPAVCVCERGRDRETVCLYIPLSVCLC